MNINQISNRTIIRILGIITSFVGLLALAWLVRQQLVWIVSAAFLAIALNPAVNWLTGYMPRKRRSLAIASVFLSAIIVVTFLAITLVPPMFTQTQELIKNLPNFVADLRNNHNVVGEAIRHYNIIGQLQAQTSTTLKSLSSVSGSVIHLAGMVFGSVLATLTVLVLTFFMLLEGPGIVERLWAYHPSPSKARNQALVRKMYASVTGYVLGNVVTSVICGVTTWLFMVIIGIPYALPIALIVGLLDLVPMVGASLGAVLGVLVALSQSLTLGVGTLAYFLVYQQVENNILQPYVYGKTIQISPLAVFVSALFGVAIGGILGALVAVPVGASLAIVFREVMKSRQGKTPDTAPEAKTIRSKSA